MASFYPSKNIPLKSLLISLGDLKKIYDRLTSEVADQGEREIAALVKPEEKSDEEWEAHTKQLRDVAFKVTVTITGKDGSSILGWDKTVFDSPNTPQEIASVFMTNATAYNLAAGVEPADKFTLTIDFSKPSLLDEDNLVSSPTPNNSRLNVIGQKDAWVAAVVEAVLGVTRGRGTKRSLIHAAFAYDLGLIVLGVPLAFYVCWKSSAFIETSLGTISNFLSAVAYVYLALVTIWIYRILFGYTKWAFPSVELEEGRNSAKKHRGFWYVIMIGLAAKIVEQMISYL